MSPSPKAIMPAEQLDTAAAALTPAPLAPGRARLRLFLGRQGLRESGDTVSHTADREQAFEGQPSGAIESRLARLTAGARRIPVDVHLGGGWCRLLLLPWHAQLTGAQRWRNLAQARVEEQFGVDVGQWELQLAQDLPGRERLAVAWPAALHALLQGCAAVRSVRVGLLEQLQDLVGRQPQFCGCVAELEGDALLALFVAHGRLRRIRACRVDPPAQLASALRTEWAGLAALRVDVPEDARLLALSVPLAQRDAARAQAIADHCAELGFARVLPLPAWV